jgi:hypothetical protein
VYTVRLRVHGHAREFFPAGLDERRVELDGPRPIREILASLGVPPELVMAVFVDGVRRDKETVAPDGSEVLLISPPAGG